MQGIGFDPNDLDGLTIEFPCPNCMCGRPDSLVSGYVPIPEYFIPDSGISGEYQYHYSYIACWACSEQYSIILRLSDESAYVEIDIDGEGEFTFGGEYKNVAPLKIDKFSTSGNSG